ncbi:MAG: L-threonylcarbamoyladenylate synthase [Rickettsiales bacterium]
MMNLPKKTFSPTLFIEAANFLRDRKLIAFPTETVYGLGANAEDNNAVSAIYKVKGRPQHNPLIVHVQDVTKAKAYGLFTPHAHRLATVFWPGPLTLVLNRVSGCPLSPSVSAGGSTVALRAPNHPLALSLLQAFGTGIAAPSANRSGRVSPTTAAHVESEFSPLPPEIAMILDGGPCDVGIESTVVDCTGQEPVILRPGSITKEMIEAALCTSLTGSTPKSSSQLKSPGLLESHYAPSLPVRLNAESAEDGEALLGFGKTYAAPTLNLSESGDLAEAATHLFACLRALDVPQYKGIAVMPIPELGIGIAINDRLKRAAAKKF